MKQVRKSLLVRRIVQHGQQYANDLAPSVVADDGKFLTIDESHPAFAAMYDKYKQDNRAKPDPKVWGPMKWATLHRWALGVGTVTDASHANVLAWLSAFGASLPKNCGCCRTWYSVMRTPPTVGDDAFEWSVAAHNQVNDELDRDPWTVEAARTKWALVEPRSTGN